MMERNRGGYGRDGGRGTRGMIQQDVRPLQTARPLTREESKEYAMDISERFYDDYRSRRNTGDARNEVTTKLQKLPTFDPELYKANAYRSLAYDPLRPVPSGLNFDEVLHRQLTATGGPRPSSGHQRRLSDPGVNRYPVVEPKQDPLPPPRPPSRRPRSALQKQLDETINPSLVPAVEEWLDNASIKDRTIATKMLRTISREGQRQEASSNPPPAAAKRRSSGRIHSARLSDDKVVKRMYNELSNQPLSSLKPLPQLKKLNRSKSEATTKGSMFTSSQRTQPSHYTIHPDWTSEASTH